MFNKLKSFSEDVAKSFNDIQNDPSRKNSEAIRQLKSGAQLLNTSTPDISALTQPTNEADESQDSGPANLAQQIPTEAVGGSQTAEVKDPLKDINLDELPQLVRAKLKKFGKYEEKYPVLLEAYKTEKRKSELVAAFEKVLQDFTPVLSIADAGLLVDYLKGLAEKATLLTTELRRVLAESAQLGREKEELNKKLADCQKTLTYAEENVTKYSNEEKEARKTAKLFEDQVQKLADQLKETEGRLVESEKNLAEKSATLERLESGNTQAPANEDAFATQPLNPETLAQSDTVAAANTKELADNHSHELEQLKADLITAQEHASLLESEKQDLVQSLEKSQKSLDESNLDSAKAIEDLKAANNKLESQLAKVETSLKSSQAQAIELEAKVKSHAENSSKLQQELNNKEKELQSKHEESSVSNDKLDELKSALEAKEEAMKQKQDEYSALQDKLKEKEDELKKLQELASSKEASPAPVTLSAQGSSGKKKKNKKQQNANRENGTIGGVQKDHELLVAEKEALVQKIAELEAKSESELAKAQGELRSVSEQLSEANTSRQSIQEKLDFTKAKLQETEARLSELQESNEQAELHTQLKSLKQEVEAKEHDLEQLRDSLKEVGNELVTAKDDAKVARDQLSQKFEQQIKELQDKQNAVTQVFSGKEATLTEELNKAKAVVSDLESKQKTSDEQVASTNKALAAAKAKLTDTQAVLKEKEAQILKLEKSLEVQTQENTKLKERIDELSKFKSADSSLKLEILSLLSSVAHKDELIRELQTSLSQKDKEKEQLNNTIATVKATNSELLRTNRDLLGEKSAMISKHEAAVERSNVLSTQLSKIQAERQSVITELESLKHKHNALLRSLATAAEDAQEYKHQYEELSMRTKETLIKIDNLEDELSDARNLLQERTREAATIRRMLIEAEEEHSIKVAEYKSEIRTLTNEKTESEMGFQSLLKKRQHEIDEIKATCEQYVKRISHLEETCEQLRLKAEPLKKASGVNEEELEKRKALENTIEELRTSLQASAKKLKDTEQMNSVLKKLNDESGLKFERLFKNYKHITQQYRQMKENSEKATVVKSEPAPAKSDANVPYLKNVLVGFLEHKDQREQLLPVLKMLFALDDKDERTLMMALK